MSKISKSTKNVIKFFFLAFYFCFLCVYKVRWCHIYQSLFLFCVNSKMADIVKQIWVIYFSLWCQLVSCFLFEQFCIL